MGAETAGPSEVSGETEAIDEAHRPASLNTNADNIYAEELAMEVCMHEHRVKRQWTEQQMVFTFAGGEVPGTPDGMFETIEGSLYCVQVVRVPVLPSMTYKLMNERLYETVLVKIIKSQAWMMSTRTLPTEFVIFCWLLPHLPARRLVRAAQRARALVKHVRRQGWPFVLKLAVAAEPEAMFPAMFGAQKAERVRKFTEADLRPYGEINVEEAEDEVCAWDVFTFDGAEAETLLTGSEDEFVAEAAAQESAEDEEQESSSYKRRRETVELPRSFLRQGGSKRQVRRLDACTDSAERKDDDGILSMDATEGLQFDGPGSRRECWQIYGTICVGAARRDLDSKGGQALEAKGRRDVFERLAYPRDPSKVSPKATPLDCWDWPRRMLGGSSALSYPPNLQSSKSTPNSPMTPGADRKPYVQMSHHCGAQALWVAELSTPLCTSAACC
mmetsp:Transcript_54594/g.130251  ORF Transcript_54594/g.130251 Transcript_54594/m.130251 type:complete len:444 (+) Transcript_54594:56-1387(+)|eukprot:CAMPEP_0178452138 /NCGR_PEP_ID=MMETSP0689_2-20121128/44074_1 /TAXON_ID=160604 /ORGANISM="Amphidinium massartii, Strain CS-259" /LENGTH=443 /DNA_ID=CAMNT_0020077803 /DNA_START=59 /DNA_END=1390 /DNA_ORIENTATION=-